MKMKLFVEGRALEGARSFYNGKYQVIIRADLDRDGERVIVLSIRREDRKPIMDWRDVQLIKNTFLGPEQEAVQLFPAESRLVDTSNQYWLYCVPNKVWPFGFTQRSVNEGVSVTVNGGQPSVQRPFAEEHRPADLEEQEERAKAALRALQGQGVSDER